MTSKKESKTNGGEPKSEICKYCLVCTKPCSDDCRDYVPNKDWEYLELKWEVEDSSPNKFRDELSMKEKTLSLFSDKELKTELERRNSK